MRKEALWLLSSTMVAAFTAPLATGTAVAQSNLTTALPIGQGLKVEPGQRMVIENFQSIPGATTSGATTSIGTVAEPQAVQLTQLDPVFTTNNNNFPVQGTTITAPQQIQLQSNPNTLFQNPAPLNVSVGGPALNAPIQVQSTNSLIAQQQIPADIRQLQAQVQTTQPQAIAPTGNGNTFFYFTQPDTVYGQPIATAPVQQQPSFQQPSFQQAQQFQFPVQQPVQATNRTIFPDTIPALPSVNPVASSGARSYIGIRGNYSVPTDYSYATTAGTSADAGSENGSAIIVSYGRKFPVTGPGSAFRAELEAAHREYDLETYGGTAATMGKTSVDSLMANAFIDVGLGAGAVVRPYAGIGGGAAQLRHADHDIGAGTIMDDRTHSPAAQGMLGVSVSMGSNIDLNFEGRHFRAFEVERKSVAGVESESTFEANEIGLGINFNF